MLDRTLHDESDLAYLEMILDLPRPAFVHDPVLGTADDQIFSVPEVKATTRAYGTGATIFPRMGHDMMLEPGWRGPAQKILDWIESGYLLRTARQ